MEIRPASLAQITRAKDGRMVTIEEDVGNVAKDLREIDHHLCLRYSESSEFFVVYWKPEDGEDGDGYLVLTAQECDQRIVKRAREISSPDYDYAAELDRQEDEALRDKERKWSDQIGEVGERLGHALRKERGLDKQRIFTPPGYKSRDS